MVRPALRALLLSAVLLASGCSQGNDPSTPSSTAPAPATVDAPATTALGAARVVLEPDGLSVVSFGASMEDTLAALRVPFGAPDETVTACPLAGPDATARRWEELTVQFVDGRFNAYTVRPGEGMAPSLRLETADHVRIGSTVAQLEATYGARVEIPGLPAEQFGGNNFSIAFPGTERRLLGSLTAPSDDGQVTAFFTQVCE